MLRLRREQTDGLPDDVEILHSAPGTLALRRGDLVAVVNCGSRPRALPPEAGDLLISSGADPPPTVGSHPTRPRGSAQA